MPDRDIQTGIQKLAGTFKLDTVAMIQATVKSVDEDKATCVCVAANDVEIPDVRLQSTVCDGLLIIPSIDSDVIIITSKYNEPFVALFGDVKKWYLQVGDSSDTITSDGKRVFNDGKFGGLIKVKDPDNTNAGLLKKINNLENIVNAFIGKYNGHTHTASSFGAPTTVPSTLQTDTLTPTQESEITSNLITHGKV